MKPVLKNVALLLVSCGLVSCASLEATKSPADLDAMSREDRIEVAAHVLSSDRCCDHDRMADIATAAILRNDGWLTLLTLRLELVDLSTPNYSWSPLLKVAAKWNKLAELRKPRHFGKKVVYGGDFSILDAPAFHVAYTQMLETAASGDPMACDLLWALSEGEPKDLKGNDWYDKPENMIQACAKSPTEIGKAYNNYWTALQKKYALAAAKVKQALDDYQTHVIEAYRHGRLDKATALLKSTEYFFQLTMKAWMEKDGIDPQNPTASNNPTLVADFAIMKSIVGVGMDTPSYKRKHRYCVGQDYGDDDDLVLQTLVYRTMSDEIVRSYFGKVDPLIQQKIFLIDDQVQQCIRDMQ